MHTNTQHAKVHEQNANWHVYYIVLYQRVDVLWWKTARVSGQGCRQDQWM